MSLFETYKAEFYAIALIIIIAVSFIGGWEVRGWRDGSKQTAAANADTKAETQAITAAVAAYNKGADALNASNQTTEANGTKLLAAIGSQSNAINDIENRIQHESLGTCTFAPVTDSVYDAAYQAAFGASHPAAKKGTANSSHGNPDPASATSTH
jgi:hypothetical protein